MARTRTTEIAYVVEGAGEFPFDMLRYDSSFPTNEFPDSAHLGCHEHHRRLVTLTHRNPQGVVSCPTPERWASFLWRVVFVGDRSTCAEFVRNQSPKNGDARWGRK